MTGKDILESISRSTLKNEPNAEKKALYEHYFPIIEAMLTFCPKEFNFDGFSSLEIFKESEDFENFIRSSTAEEIKVKFECILSDFKTAKNANDIIEEASGAGVKNLMARQKSKHTVSNIVISAIAVLSVIIIIFSLLEIFEVLNTNNLITGICGVADFGCGIGFFIYEFLSDKKTKEISDKVKMINGQVVYNKNIKVKGSNNNFGIRNDINDRARLASEFLKDIHNEKIKVKGDNNNFGIRV